MRGRDRVFVDANELFPFSVMDLVPHWPSTSGSISFGFKPCNGDGLVIGQERPPRQGLFRPAHAKTVGNGSPRQPSLSGLPADEPLRLARFDTTIGAVMCPCGRSLLLGSAEVAVAGSGPLPGIGLDRGGHRLICGEDSGSFASGFGEDPVTLGGDLGLKGLGRNRCRKGSVDALLAFSHSCL